MWSNNTSSTDFTMYAFFFFFNDTATTEIYTLSLHDALPICFNARVRSAAARHFAQGVGDAVDFLVVDRLRAAFLREAEPFGNAVDGDHAFGAEHEGAADRELSDRSAAPDGDGIAGLEVAILRGHVAGGKNVGQKQHLFIGQSVFDLHRPHVRERHAGVLRLSAGVA